MYISIKYDSCRYSLDEGIGQHHALLTVFAGGAIFELRTN
jgi:hypothetical protein